MRRTPAERAEFVERAAAHMAANPTKAEDALYDILIPLGFISQWSVGGSTKNGGAWIYILDFYHAKLKLCVEVDGGVHARTKGRDRRRGTRLAGEDIQTVRFTNKEVLKTPEFVRALVVKAMHGLEMLNEQ
jgi:very-short-patch-repair endonuclease